MELTRNSDDKKFRNADFHFDRLREFSKGMGIDLEIPQGPYSNKKLTFHRTSHNDALTFDDYNLDFSVHDEGLETPDSVIVAARNIIDKAPVDYDTRTSAQEELYHRTAYKASTLPHVNYGYIGLVYKNVNSIHNVEIHDKWGRPPSPYEDNHPNFRTALESTRGRFRAQNLMHRPALDQNVQELVQHALRNPDEKTLQDTLRNRPHMDSSQFARIVIFNPSATEIKRTPGDVSRDVLDLKAGNWAKIDPDGYFPD